MIVIFIREIISAKKSAEPVSVKYRNLIKYFFAPLVLVAVLVIIYRPLVFTRTSTTDHLENWSVTDRLDYLAQAKSMIGSHWLLGVGEGNYTYNLYQNNAAKTPWHYQPVHNIFMLIFAELGIVGLIIFLIFLISLFLNFRIICRREKDYSHVDNIVFLTTILIIGCFDHYLWTSYVGAMVLFICFALLEKKDYSGSV